MSWYLVEYKHQDYGYWQIYHIGRNRRDAVRCMDMLNKEAGMSEVRLTIATSKPEWHDK